MKDGGRTLIVTRDGGLLHVVVEATKPATVEIRFDAHSAAKAVQSTEFALVVLDDEVLTESERGWMIDECHRRQPAAPIVYVGSPRSEANERMANCHRVAYYAAKPLDPRTIHRSIRKLVSRGLDRQRTTRSAPPERTERHGDPTNPGTD